jgi:hypothetical protein
MSGQVKDSARNPVSDRGVSRWRTVRHAVRRHEYRLRQVADLAILLGVLSTGGLVYDVLLHR